MQDLTDELLDTLAGHFQAAAQGYRCRVEIDSVIPEIPPDTVPGLVQMKHVGNAAQSSITLDSPVAIGSVLVARLIKRQSEVTPTMVDGSWTLLGVGAAHGSENNTHGSVAIYAKVATSTSPVVDREASANQMWMTVYEIAGATLADVTVLVLGHQPGTTADLGDFNPATGVAIMGFAIPRGTDQRDIQFGVAAAAGWTEEFSRNIDNTLSCQSGVDPWMWGGHAVDQATLDASVTITDGFCSGQFVEEWAGIAVLFTVSGGTPGSHATNTYHPIRVGIDRSRRLVAAQCDIELENELGGLGVSPTSALTPDAPFRVFEWYGGAANEVQTFAGLLDPVKEGRDVRRVTLTGRDYMKWLIAQTFSASAPQGADEAGAVRTAANGVYLEAEASDIVTDILERAGVPDAQRAITPTSYMLDEYILADGASWADCIIGDDKITGLTGYEMGADEHGVIYFRPVLASAAVDSDTDPVPDYSYVVSATPGDNLVSPNVLRLDHALDDYDLKTRVKVRASLAIAKPAWTELWHTNTFTKPVGIMYDPAASSFLFVLDRATKKIYRLQQSNRARAPLGIWPLYVGADVTYPLGLSGDPANAAVMWVLEAAWRVTGGANLNASIHKYNKTTGAHLAEYSLPNGRWTDIKVSSSFLWLTNKDTDKTHKRSKTDGSSIASYTTTVSAIAQLNPTGVFVDDTTLGLFFLGHARFVLVDESDPTVPDGTNALGVASYTISTAGTAINGGEMDTDTDAHLFACSDDLGLVWKFALTEPSTTAVFSELVDIDLEDSLGFLSGTKDREHDAHPGDADHAFEIRRETLTMAKTITNLAQATETAHRRLAAIAHRRETLDLGIVGHPGHQIGDLIQVTDPVTEIDALYVLDTYRDNMDERGYLGTVALVPYSPTY